MKALLTVLITLSILLSACTITKTIEGRPTVQNLQAKACSVSLEKLVVLVNTPQRIRVFAPVSEKCALIQQRRGDFEASELTTQSIRSQGYFDYSFNPSNTGVFDYWAKCGECTSDKATATVSSSGSSQNNPSPASNPCLEQANIYGFEDYYQAPTSWQSNGYECGNYVVSQCGYSSNIDDAGWIDSIKCCVWTCITPNTEPECRLNLDCYPKGRAYRCVDGKCVIPPASVPGDPDSPSCTQDSNSCLSACRTAYPETDSIHCESGVVWEGGQRIAYCPEWNNAGDWKACVLPNSYSLCGGGDCLCVCEAWY